MATVREATFQDPSSEDWAKPEKPWDIKYFYIWSILALIVGVGYQFQKLSLDYILGQDVISREVKTIQIVALVLWVNYSFEFLYDRLLNKVVYPLDKNLTKEYPLGNFIIISSLIFFFLPYFLPELFQIKEVYILLNTVAPLFTLTGFLPILHKFNPAFWNNALIYYYMNLNMFVQIAKPMTANGLDKEYVDGFELGEMHWNFFYAQLVGILLWGIFQSGGEMTACLYQDTGKLNLSALPEVVSHPAFVPNALSLVGVLYYSLDYYFLMYDPINYYIKFEWLSVVFICLTIIIPSSSFTRSMVIRKTCSQEKKDLISFFVHNVRPSLVNQYIYPQTTTSTNKFFEDHIRFLDTILLEENENPDRVIDTLDYRFKVPDVLDIVDLLHSINDTYRIAFMKKVSIQLIDPLLENPNPPKPQEEGADKKIEAKDDDEESDEEDWKRLQILGNQDKIKQIIQLLYYVSYQTVNHFHDLNKKIEKKINVRYAILKDALPTIPEPEEMLMPDPNVNPNQYLDKLLLDAQKQTMLRLEWKIPYPDLVNDQENVEKYLKELYEKQLGDVSTGKSLLWMANEIAEIHNGFVYYYLDVPTKTEKEDEPPVEQQVVLYIQLPLYI